MFPLYGERMRCVRNLLKTEKKSDITLDFSKGRQRALADVSGRSGGKRQNPIKFSTKFFITSVFGAEC